MAGAAVEYRFDDEEVRRYLDKLGALAMHPRPILADIGGYLLRSTEENFEGEHEPDGTPWKPLKIRTRYSRYAGRKKSKDGKNLYYTDRGQVRKPFQSWLSKQKILTDSGDLRDSIRYQVKGGAVLVGTNKVYGAAHQFGAEFSILKTRAHAKIPARPYLGISDRDRKEILEILKSHLENH